MPEDFGRESARLDSLVQLFAEPFESRLRRAATRAGHDQLRLRILAVSERDGCVDFDQPSRYLLELAPSRGL
jgi:hypothetical protein